MSNKASIYLPTQNPELITLLSETKIINRELSLLEVEVEENLIQFNFMEQGQIPPHLLGFIGYVSRLSDSDESKTEAINVIQATKTVIGVVSGKSFKESPTTWELLFKIAKQYSGFVFAYDSIILADETPLVGPLSYSGKL